MNELFGVYHIVALCVSILIIIGMVILFKKISLEKIISVMFYIGIASEVIKVFSYILVNEDVLDGYLPKTDLPFHLCSIQIIFLFVLKMMKNEKIRKLLFGFMMPTCLIGAFAALILPTSSARNIRPSDTSSMFKQRPDAKPAASANYSVGDRVVHKKFGTGMIISTKPMGNDMYLEVAFDDVGTKKLMANMPFLKKI